MKLDWASIWATRNASPATPRTEIRATSFCSAMKSLRSGGPDAPHGLGEDDVPHRLLLGQTDRQGGFALAGMDRAHAGAVDLGDVSAVGERERDPAQDDGSVGRPSRSKAGIPNPMR